MLGGNSIKRLIIEFLITCTFHTTLKDQIYLCMASLLHVYVCIFYSHYIIKQLTYDVFLLIIT
jgi:hypothetical protein